MEETQKQTETLPLAEPQEAQAEDKEQTAFCNKFATAGELEKAYGNLQREFTRKCQQNAQLSRELESYRAGAAKEAEGDGEPLSARPEGQENDMPTAENGAEAKTPVYESPEWDDKVKDFMKKYPKAARYTQEIARKLATDGELALREDCLERAFFDVLQSSDRSFEELAADEEFLQKYVYENERVKDRIIREFLRKNMDVSAPRMIADGGRTHVTPPSRPKSISEAGGIVKNMLANRRI